MIEIEFTEEELQNEIWKDVEKYEHLYAISTLGRLLRKSYTYLSPFSGEKVVSSSIITGAKKEGYFQALLCKLGLCKFFMVHRLVGDAFIPNPENKPFINHKNSIRNDNRVENLEWCTPKENSIHAHSTSKGRFKMPSGEKSVNCKLKDSDIVYIRGNPDKLSQNALAVKFGVTQGLISKIMNFKKR